MDPVRVGQSLARAREAWEISVSDLADQCELSPSDVEAAERGEGDVGTLGALAAGLGGSLDDLFAGRPFWEAPTIAFRAPRARLDRAAVRATLLRLSLAAAAYRDARRLVTDADDPLTIDPAPLGDAPEVQAETLAARVRELLSNPREPIASVRAVLNSFGFATFLSAFPASDLDGVSWRDVDGQGFAAANVNARRGRVTAIRMTFAHELCHLLFDGSRGVPLGIMERRLGSEDAAERRANAFAAHLLAPRNAVAAFLRRRGLPFGKPPHAQDVLALSSHFGMGVEAVAGHLVTCRYWERDDLGLPRHRSLQTELVDGPDNAESHTQGPAWIVPLERRGEVLDFATAALEGGKISLGRWRELVGLSPFEDHVALLEERNALDHVEHHSV